MIRWLSLGRSSAMNKIGFDGALCCTPSSASLGHASNISARYLLRSYGLLQLPDVFDLVKSG